ncbi:MAG: DUF3160 domain-containing protein [Deltaproteobacteria bacterium]|nr:DUF3160 domain-containing protein [Deltaproteobacteria bacterium]
MGLAPVPGSPGRRPAGGAMKKIIHPLALALALAPTLPSGLGCSDGGSPAGPSTHVPTAPPPTPPTPIDPERSPEDEAQLELLRGQLDLCAELETDDFLARHAVPFASDIDHTPSEAAGLPLIQASTFGLNAAELAALDQRGFVITERHRFPTFTYGYEAIYAQDLPLYVSADSILYALHRSYDAILQALETTSLIPELAALLDGMRQRLAAAADADVDLYVTVAASLLAGELQAPVAGADRDKVKDLYDGALAATGMGSVVLFGEKRDVDFSQFEPRGHYRDTPELMRYFRAMMWLGRVDLRIIETRPDGSQEFRRRELMAAFALRDAMDAAAVLRWQKIHDAIGGFVGLPDSMTPPELDKLLVDLEVTSAAALDALSDDALATAIVKGGYGTQRIASQIMFAVPGADTLPLASSFMLFGQAYVIDSHVFSNLVFDRVGGGGVYRMMPDPLDVAYAVLGNEQAASLMSQDLAAFDHAPDLCGASVLVEGHGADYWQASLYGLWLDALRALSPARPDLADADAAGLPATMTTEAWGRRMLNAQLASWAELRHDTLLYAKQSYTAGVACEFPDAYVDPYPAFWDALGRFAQRGQAIVSTLDLGGTWLGDRVVAWLDELAAVTTTLGDMARRQRDGRPFTDEQMAFINEAVVVQMGCGDPEGATGWYARLFFDQKKGVELDPTIADVHTQPTDEAGAIVGRVLHVGTGMPRLMVVTAETCNGPRAYAGLVSSYFEKVTEGFERLNDEEWATELQQGTPADVRWMQDLVVR